MTPLDLETLRLERGRHRPGSNRFCLMEAVACLAGEPWSDDPACVSPTIAAVLRHVNDGMTFSELQTLKPFIRRVIGTRTTDADELIRAWMTTDWLVRTFAPAWLDVAGLTAEATSLRALPALTSDDVAAAAMPTITAAEERALDASDATKPGARADVRALVDSTSRSPAQLAAQWSAVAIAWSVHQTPAHMAARAPTGATLRASALPLVERMIAVGRQATAIDR